MSTPYTIRDDNQAGVTLIGDFGGFSLLVTSKYPNPNPDAKDPSVVETEKMDEAGVLSMIANLLAPLTYHSPGELPRMISVITTQLVKRGCA